MPCGWIFAYIIGNICMSAVAVTQVSEPWLVGLLLFFFQPKEIYISFISLQKLLLWVQQYIFFVEK